MSRVHSCLCYSCVKEERDTLYLDNNDESPISRGELLVLAYINYETYKRHFISFIYFYYYHLGRCFELSSAFWLQITTQARKRLLAMHQMSILSGRPFKSMSEITNNVHNKPLGPYFHHNHYWSTWQLHVTDYGTYGEVTNLLGCKWNWQRTQNPIN